MPTIPSVARIPLTLKLAYLAFVAVLVPIYAAHHGPANFLWFSNIALLGGLLAVWLESRRLASMLLVSVGLLEMGWIADFLIGLATGGQQTPVGLVAYMFDPELPLYLRGLSLYHLPLPFVLLWVVWRLGYDRQAWRAWLPIGWAVIVLSYLLAPPGRNINWVKGPEGVLDPGVPGPIWLLCLIVGSGIAWWLTHKVIESGLGRFGRIAAL